ncbi:MAG: DUF4013 domain-containing protein [Planctomycetaceae bacterium]
MLGKVQQSDSSTADVLTLDEHDFHDDSASPQQIPVELSDENADWVDLPLPLQSDYPWCPVPWRHPLGAAFWLVRTGFSLASLVLILAIVAAIPIVNFIALGYLLEVEARVARSGRLLAAFPLLNQASRVGVIAAGIWLFLIPLRFLSGYAADAVIIDPTSPTTAGLQIATQIVWFLTTAHILLALARGGSIGCFVRPFKNVTWLVGQLWSGNYLNMAGQNVRDFVHKLQLRALFWKGLRGFGVAFVWLLIPTAMYAALRRPEGVPVLLTILGGFALAFTLMLVPFMQARFTTTGRFMAGLEIWEVRRAWKYAPIAWTLSLVFLYLLALPLYLFKAFLPPRDAMWLMTLVFVITIYPTRIFTGWAYARALKRRELNKVAHWSIRLICTALLWPLMGLFVFILFFTQFLGAEGRLVLFAHHALLLPAPFFLFGG